MGEGQQLRDQDKGVRAMSKYEKFKNWCKENCVLIGFIYLVILTSWGLYLNPYGNIKEDLRNDHEQEKKIMTMLKRHEKGILFLDDRVKKLKWSFRKEGVKEIWQPKP